MAAKALLFLVILVGCVLAEAEHRIPPPGSDPATWSPGNKPGPPGSDPATWSPGNKPGPPGSDPATWSPQPKPQVIGGDPSSRTPQNRPYIFVPGVTRQQRSADAVPRRPALIGSDPRTWSPTNQRHVIGGDSSSRTPQNRPYIFVPGATRQQRSADAVPRRPALIGSDPRTWSPTGQRHVIGGDSSSRTPQNRPYIFLPGATRQQRSAEAYPGVRNAPTPSPEDIARVRGSESSHLQPLGPGGIHRQPLGPGGIQRQPVGPGGIHRLSVDHSSEEDDDHFVSGVY